MNNFDKTVVLKNSDISDDNVLEPNRKELKEEKNVDSEEKPKKKEWESTITFSKEKKEENNPTIVLKDEEKKEEKKILEPILDETIVFGKPEKKEEPKSNTDETIVFKGEEYIAPKESIISTSHEIKPSSIKNSSRKTDKESSKVNAKSLFKRQVISGFRENADFKTLIEKKKVTDEKTDVFIDIDDHFKEEDEVGIGYVIDGKYELFELITRKSGEAAIYKCSVRGLAGVYVAKIYYPNIQPKEDIMEKILSNINSEHVIKLNMIGFILTESGRRLYEIMPFYGRGTLEQRMPLTENEVIEKIVPSINEGLRAIHRINIIHRDLKPNNIFIDAIGIDDTKKAGFKLYNNEHIVIADFGISSQIKNGATHRVTSASRTRGYGAPETIRDNITTQKSDYFSFGITLLTLLIGEYPYHDEIEMILKIKENIWNFPKGISPRMQALIKGLMNYDRNLRFGYDEVNDWLDNKVVNVQPAVEDNKLSSVEIQQPYEYKFKQYYNLTTLVEAMTQDWNFSIQHIENRFIDKYFKGASNDFDIVLSDMDRLRHIGAGNDKIFLLLIYSVLRPNGIIYADLNFKSLEDMSDYILSCNEPDKRIINLVKNKILGYVLSLINRYSKPVGDIDKLKSIISRVEDKMAENEKMAFYLLGYVFNSDKKNIDLLKKGIVRTNCVNKITSIEDIYAIFNQTNDKEGFADKFLSDPKCIAWLYYKGYSQNKSFMK